MSYVAIDPAQREEFNRVVTHPLQSYEWGEFREKTGVKVIRRGLFSDNILVEAFQLTIHPIPHTPFTIGYLPKGSLPTRELIEELRLIGKEEKCVFIQLEPNVVRQIYKNDKGHLNPDNPQILRSAQDDNHLEKLGLIDSARPLFTKYTFVLDLTKSEEELLSNMHSKTRYNIKVARNHGVSVKVEDSDEAFMEYLKLTRETTTRQKFYAHTEGYHRTQWEVLKCQISNIQFQMSNEEKNKLTSHLLLGKIEATTLVAWILFTFKEGLYYPYGASSTEHREAMASNLVMYEAIMFGKKLNLTHFDMWGALGPTPDTSDSWYGFHRFKIGYGADLVENIGSYDLVIKPSLYQVYKITDKLRWMYLRMRK